MKHSDFKFWFLDDSIDGIVSDRSIASKSYKNHGRGQDRTPEKKYSAGAYNGYGFQHS
jgi:hypothetical protein